MGEDKMKQKHYFMKVRNILIIILMTFTCVNGSDAGTLEAHAETNTSQEVVRVGYFAFEGYHMMDEDGRRSGYGYDFLRMAARYLNVKYKYVGYDKSWDEMQDMLEDGKIDLLTSAQKTEDREKLFDFSKPIGTSSAMLTVKSDNTSIIEQEYSTYENMRVGMLRENSRNDDFAKLAEEKGFSYQVVYYDMESDIKAALQKGEIDAALTSSLRSIDNEHIIEKFATDDFYVMVKKGNTHLLNEINYAIDQMNLAEGDWKDSLNYQYYGQTESRNLSFSKHEREIIQQYASGEKKLRVSCSIDRSPYSYVDNGKLKGIIPDMFAGLMEEAGLPYEVVIPKNREEYEVWQKDGSVDIFMDARIADETAAEEDGVAITAPYMDMGLAMVTRRDFDGTIRKLGVARYQGAEGIEEDLAVDAERVYFDTREDAMNAVRDGDVDATFVYLYTAQKFVNLDSRGSVTYTVLDEPVYPYRISIMPSADAELSGILTKCIYAYPKTRLESLISDYTTVKLVNTTLFTLIMLHPVKSAALLLVAIALLLLLVSVSLKMHENHKLVKVERKRAEEKDVLAKLAKSANESKSRFLFNMSHDIRTPLNAVLGFTNLAKEAIGDDEKELDYLDKIQISGEHLLEVVNDVLEMSRVETGTISLEEKECCIKDIIDAVVLISGENSRKKNQQFIVNLSELKYPYVWCDSLRVKEILSNLLENAVNYTQPEGRIELTIKQQPAGREGYADLEIRVKDNGCGMEKDFVEKLFQPFMREQSATVSGLNGTGLGLAIIKRYVDAMGGTISVQTEKNVGSEFVVRLCHKLAEKTKEISSEAAKEDEKTQFYGKRILIVEDNDLNREIEVAILEDAGFLVEEAVDGQKAVEKVKDAKDGYYDGILMDIQMPVMDGYEATREIRKLKNPMLARIPIIAVSANAFDEDKIASEKAGMNAHIEKPIRLDYLFDTLSNILKNEK
ncbi:transporter substrate-binding domain-containing protein [Blautia sp. MSJ-9]|uniref:transporter substrate-binding domain-containing protein n=1 Tax=Blautia sp. MSJ-9 TaxID=2841511 RepID=UPI001C0FDA12|nr:transporter substrate-binding domain-containing protein [Blautia sp. MSJ-9]MBU5678988.1 transporter substrate-binding domain-containing protein [Blautia sp. MSJ-9]